MNPGWVCREVEELILRQPTTPWMGPAADRAQARRLLLTQWTLHEVIRRQSLVIQRRVQLGDKRGIAALFCSGR